MIVQIGESYYSGTDVYHCIARALYTGGADTIAAIKYIYLECL
jgi:hypothetical protein